MQHCSLCIVVWLYQWTRNLAEVACFQSNNRDTKKYPQNIPHDHNIKTNCTLHSFDPQEQTKRNCSATQKLFEDNCAEHSLPEVE